MVSLVAWAPNIMDAAQEANGRAVFHRDGILFMWNKELFKIKVLNYQETHSYILFMKRLIVFDIEKNLIYV